MIPFFIDPEPESCRSKLISLVLTDPVPSQARNIPPANEMIARKMSDCARRPIISTVISIMGKSVMRGDNATLIPSVLLCFKVCASTRVSNGPGERPDDKPSNTPADTKCQILSVISGFVVIESANLKEKPDKRKIIGFQGLSVNPIVKDIFRGNKLPGSQNKSLNSQAKIPTGVVDTTG